MNTKQDYIAVFDSGVGGISVLRHLRRLMPGERYLYFGDSANAPYGTKTKDEVEALTFAAARRLMARGVKALVVACNTATSAAIHDLREAYPDTIVIGIEPALKLAYDRYHGGGIGVMATPMTLREEKFEALMHRYDQSCRVYKIPAPGLVELVERGQADSPEAESLLRELFAPYQGGAGRGGAGLYPLSLRGEGHFPGAGKRRRPVRRGRRHRPGDPPPSGGSGASGKRNRRGHPHQQSPGRVNSRIVPEAVG